MKMRGIWRDALRVGGAYIAFCIGSGYATGQEILQFFTAFGWKGLGSAAIAMGLYAWMGAALMGETGRRLAPQSDRAVWAHYCGRKLGRVMDGIVVCVSFCGVVIMVAGAGAALEQQCGLPLWAGRGAMCLVCLLTVLLGLQGLVEILGIVGPVIIVFSCVLGVGGLVQGAGNPAEAAGLLEQLPRSCGNWVLSGVLYAAFMAPLCVPFLTHLSGTARSAKGAALGGAAGGTLLMAAVMLMSTALLLRLDAVYQAPIPTLVLANGLHPLLGSGFTGVVLLGIYSTAVPQLWLVCRKAGPDGTNRYCLAAVGTAAAGLAGSALPFAKLVNTVYPATGYLGLLLLACLVCRRRGPCRAPGRCRAAL